jgi:hypothetical protein
MPAWILPAALSWSGDPLAIEARVLFLWRYVRSSEWLSQVDHASQTTVGFERSENFTLSCSPDFGGCPGRWSGFVLVEFQQP